MKWDALDEEPCSVARTVAVIGDRWTLLILRDCFLRVRRFDDFQASLGITRHLLAGRLKKLVSLNTPPSSTGTYSNGAPVRLSISGMRRWARYALGLPKSK